MEIYCLEGTLLSGLRMVGGISTGLSFLDGPFALSSWLMVVLLMSNMWYELWLVLVPLVGLDRCYSSTAAAT